MSVVVDIRKEIIVEMNESAKTETNKNENFSIVSSKPKKSMMCSGKSHKEYSYKPLINDDALRKIREGWNVKNVSDLTVGDLYLMFGSDSKLTLEYKFNDENVGSAEQEIKMETNPLGNKLKSLLSIANLIENPIACHSSEKSHSVDVKEGGVSETIGGSVSTFKQPPTSKTYFDPYVRPLLNPRLKPHQSKWWRNQQLYRYRMPTDGLIPNNIKNNVGNHVIRNLYETPPSTSHNSGSASSEITDEPDELTRTLEDKIQNLTNPNSPYIQNFSESSRSSIRSLLETLSSNKSNYDYGE